MRKNLLFRILLIAVPLTMLFSCTKRDDMSIDKTQKVDLVFQANMTKPTLKAANLPYDEMLAGLDCAMKDYGTIRVKIATDAELPGGVLPEGITSEDDLPGTYYYLSYTKVGDGVASDLVQLQPGTYYLTLFQVGNGDANSWEPLLATPMDGSAFKDFVTDVLPYEFQIGEYQKNRVVLDVLCFNQQLAPAFGFEWFDYNIVQGDQICVFVNCINPYDREYYHQVFAADMYAWKTADGETPSEDAPYWFVGSNYSLETPETGDGSMIVGSVTPMCFPLYDVLEDMSDGLLLQLNPVFGKTAEGELIFSDSIMVHISLNIIEQYLGLIPIPEPNVGESGGSGITVKVELTDDPQADNPRFIHIMLNDCHKPAYFESHNDGNGVAAIYALRFVGSNVLMTKILDFSQMGRDPHIAVAPNRRQLYVVDSDNSGQIYVYDLYSMSYVALPVDPNGAPEKITQLVFMNDTLFAADMNADELTFYVLDPDGLNYSEYSTVTLDPSVDFSGGDLIATDAGTLWSFSKNGSSAYVHEINLSTGETSELANEAGMLNVFGAMVYEDNATIITGDAGATGLESWSWDGTSFSMLGTYTPVPDFTYLYGDLASPFILSRSAPQ